MSKKKCMLSHIKIFNYFNNRKIKGLKMFKYLFLIISFISISFSSYAETIEIDMVNKLGKEKWFILSKLQR